MSLLKKMSLFSECYGDSTLGYVALITSFVFLGFSLLGMYPKALPHKQQQVKSHLSELIALKCTKQEADKLKWQHQSFSTRKTPAFSCYDQLQRKAACINEPHYKARTSVQRCQSQKHSPLQFTHFSLSYNLMFT